MKHLSPKGAKTTARPATKKVQGGSAVRSSRTTPIATRQPSTSCYPGGSSSPTATVKLPPSKSEATARRAKQLVSDGYVGLKEFRDVGGSIIAEVSKSEQSINVGTSTTNLLIRLRPVSRHPNTAAKVPKHRVLRFDAVKEKMTQVRAVIAFGGKFVFLSKGGSRVLADRHPDFDRDLIESYVVDLERVFAKDFYGDIKDEIAALSSRLSGLGSNPRYIAEIEEKYENLLKKVNHIIFQRGANAEVEAATKPTASDLSGFRDD